MDHCKLVGSTNHLNGNGKSKPNWSRGRSRSAFESVNESVTEFFDGNATFCELTIHVETIKTCITAKTLIAQGRRGQRDEEAETFLDYIIHCHCQLLS
jgi:hypothetical protein